MNAGSTHRLVILGSGFGAIQAARRLGRDRRFAVTLISPRNYFLFTPLLTSTTVGTIEFRSVIEPVRALAGVRYYQAHAEAIDTEARVVRCRQASDQHEFDVEYDELVVAVGALPATFGIPGVREHAVFLRDLADARRLRQNTIELLERAAAPGVEEAERDRLLSFVVVGGGPTGVEFAAELHDFVVEDLPRWFPDTAGRVRIVLLEASGTILSGFGTKLREFALRLFSRENIEVRMHAAVTAITEDAVVLSDGSELPYGLCVWSTGIAPTRLVESLPWPKNSRGQLQVDDHLRAPGLDNVYALGDCAALESRPLPATAQVAQQQGKYLGKAIGARRSGRPPRPFRFRALGMLAYVGDRRALADLPHWEGRGWVAWLFWRSVYLTRLVSWRNKVLVLFDWMKAGLFGRDPSRF